MNTSSKLEYWFVFQNDRLLVSKVDTQILTSSSIKDLQNLIRQYQLTELNDRIIYCAELNKDITLPDNLETISFRNALESLGDDWYNIAVKAYSIIQWDKNHHYCGRCGSLTIQKIGAFERICTHCSLAFYPRISPSIIVLIHKGDEILMARSPHFLPGVYALIAGFVEAGESLEDAVYREVQEEVGIKIKNLRYFGSQAWPFPDSLMVAFHADYDSGEIVINETEIEAAGWYRYDNLPGLPSTHISISRKLIDHYLAEHI